jgi:hypothetical protein
MAERWVAGKWGLQEGTERTELWQKDERQKGTEGVAALQGDAPEPQLLQDRADGLKGSKIQSDPIKSVARKYTAVIHIRR